MPYRKSITFFHKKLFPTFKNVFLAQSSSTRMIHYSQRLVFKIRCGSRAAATSKMERFVIIVNGFQTLTIITKRSILVVAAVLDPSLKIVPHCFGDNEKYNEKWCSGKLDASYKHKSLPYGRNLCGDGLKKDLNRIFEEHAKNATALSPNESTSTNESFNLVVVSKEPKMHHY